MATFNADILLNVKSGKAESAVKKIEAGQKKIAIASNKILATDKRIVGARRQLLTSDKSSAALQRQKIAYLRQQKSELLVQKRELSKIVALEKKSTKSRNARGSGVGGALAGAGIGAGLTKSFFDASELENAEARVKILGQTYSQLTGIQEAATKSSEKFLISNVDAIKAYVDLGNRLGSQGATIADIENIYEGLNTVLVTNKATAQEAASATLQLNQALGAGKLAGEEYRAVNEATPQVITEVAKVLGVARGEVKKLASEGAVSSQVLLQALTNLRKEGADGLKEGLSGAFAAQREFSKALKEFSQVVGTELLPVITPLLQDLSKLLKVFGTLPGPVKKVAVGLAAVTVAALALAPALGAVATGLGAITATGLIAAAPWAALALGLGYVAAGAYTASVKVSELEARLRDTSGSGEELKNKMNETAAEIERLEGTLDSAGPSADYVRKKIELLTASLETMEGRYEIQIAVNEIAADVRANSIQGFDTLTPQQMDEALGRGAYAPVKTTKRRGGGGGRSSVDTAAREAAQAEKERLALVERQQTAYEEIKQTLERTILLESELTTEGLINSDLQKARLQSSFDLEDSVKRINETVAAGNRAELVALAELKKEQADSNNLKDSASDFAGFFADAAAIDKELNEELTKTEKLANSIGDQLSTGITDALVGAVNGTKDLGEAFQGLAADILQAVGKALILQAITGAVGSVGGGGIIGGLFPGRASGGPVNGGSPYIVGEEGPELYIPGASGSITNNDQFEAARKAMGGSNNSSNDAFADNAEAIGTTNSYTKERILERERIASINSNPIDVRAETTVINNVEYVTAEQFSQGMKSTARDAQAKVLSDLRNRPSIRRQVGVG